MPLPLSGRVMVMEVSAFKSLSALVWACGNLGIVCLNSLNSVKEECAILDKRLKRSLWVRLQSLEMVFDWRLCKSFSNL